MLRSTLVAHHLPTSFTPPRVHGGLEQREMSALLSACITKKRRSCSDLMAMSLRNLSLTRTGKRPEQQQSQQTALLLSARDSPVVFGAADLLRRAGEWSRAMELLAAAHAAAASPDIARDAAAFHSLLRPASTIPPRQNAGSHADEGDPWIRHATEGRRGGDVASDDGTFPLSKAPRAFRTWGNDSSEEADGAAALAATATATTEAVPFDDDCVHAAALASLAASIQAAQAVLRAQEKQVLLAPQQKDLGSAAASALVEAQVRAERARREQHAKFSEHIACALHLATNLVSTAIQIIPDADTSGPHNHPRRRNPRLRMTVRSREKLLDAIACLADICARCHQLQAALAAAAAARSSSLFLMNSANAASSSSSISASSVLIPPASGDACNVSASLWRLDPLWPTLSMDAVVARLLLEVPDVPRRDLVIVSLQNVNTAREQVEHIAAAMQHATATAEGGRKSNAVAVRDRIEDVLDRVLMDPGDGYAVSSRHEQAASTTPPPSPVDARAQQEGDHKLSSAAQSRAREQRLKYGRLFFRAAVADPHIAGTALRAFQFHNAREVLDAILTCVATFVTDTAEREMDGRPAAVDDTVDALRRAMGGTAATTATANASAALWPFVQRLLEAVQAGDSRAVYVRRDRRLVASSGGSFTDDWMKSGPDNNSADFVDEEDAAAADGNFAERQRPRISQEQQSLILQLNTRRFLVIADLVCDLAWQAVGSVVCGKVTLQAARATAVPAIRLTCEIAATLPVLDAARLLPLLFVAAQGLGVSAWEGNLKLPLARFLWFLDGGSATADGNNIHELFRLVLTTPRGEFDWSDGKLAELEPRRAAAFARAVFSELSRIHQRDAGGGGAASAAKKQAAPLSRFGSAVLPVTSRASSSWLVALRVLAPLTQANGFTPLHQKMALVACADARQWAVGLHLFTNHCRMVPATQVSVAILLDFIRDSSMLDRGARAIQLVVEAHIVGNNQHVASSRADAGGSRARSAGRPTQTVMLRLCRLVADRSSGADPAAAMRFFRSLVVDGALNNAVENCGPHAYAPFMRLFASSGSTASAWQDALFVVAAAVQHRRFFEAEQLAPLVEPQSKVPSGWAQALRCLTHSARQRQRAVAGDDSATLPVDVCAAAGLALAAAHDYAACRAVLSAISAHRTSSGGRGRLATDLRNAASPLRMKVHSLCSYNDHAATVLERELARLK